MSNGAKFDYCFENKTIWRRKVWDAIHHRISIQKIRPKNAVCVYLAAELDLDFSVASEHGFSRNNMISVERDSRVCSLLRKNGVLTYGGDLTEALWAFAASPKSPKINAVNADLCSGITKHVDFDFGLCLIANHALYNSVISINLLRGRDSYSNEQRRLWQSLNEWKEHAALFGVPPNHRGLLFFEMIQDSYLDMKYLNLSPEELYKNKSRTELVIDSKLKLFSYKSSCGQVFDSCVFINKFRDILPSGSLQKMDEIGFELLPDSQMAAILATRTRRINETKLTPCSIVNGAN